MRDRKEAKEWNKRNMKIIWDFDGTLFDTYPAMVDGAWQALKDFGISMDKRNLLQNEKYSTSYLINESNLNARV